MMGVQLKRCPTCKAAPKMPCDWTTWPKHVNTDAIAIDVLADAVVVTIFWGIDQRQKGDDGPPLLWESRVFGGRLVGSQTCTASWLDALEAHNALVNEVKGAAKPEGPNDDCHRQ